MNRKFFVEENRGSLDSIYLLLVNDASLNDPKETQSFTAKFSRIETSFASSWYFWSSAAWILTSSFFLVLIAQLASESDKQILKEKHRYLAEGVANAASEPDLLKEQAPATNKNFQDEDREREGLIR